MGKPRKSVSWFFSTKENKITYGSEIFLRMCHSILVQLQLVHCCQPQVEGGFAFEPNFFKHCREHLTYIRLILNQQSDNWFYSHEKSDSPWRLNQIMCMLVSDIFQCWFEDIRPLQGIAEKKKKKIVKFNEHGQKKIAYMFKYENFWSF